MTAARPMAAERGDLRFCLVVPEGNDELASGGGQRSALFYRAMAALAPTDVVVLSYRDAEGATSPVFPGARIRHVKVGNVVPRHRNPLREGLRAARKLLAIEGYYAPSPGVPARIAALGGARGYDLAVFRYLVTLTSCAEASFGADCRRALDLDDRDDQKYAAMLHRRFGASAPVRLVGANLARRIRKVFAAHLPRVPLIWVVDRRDAPEGLEDRTRLVPNTSINEPAEPPAPASRGDGLLFVGTAQHPPNQNGLAWFLRECWPLVRADCPGATLRIVGIGGWADMPLPGADMAGVEIVGPVASVAAEYARARAAISPIFDGGGSKIKVVESCAFGRPAICTPHSARGFDGALADALPMGADARSFAARCVEMLSDPARADEVGARARAAQRRDYSVEGVCRRIRDDILDLLGPGRPAAADGAA